MAPRVRHHEPKVLRAGETWVWTTDFHEFPTTDSPQWTITYYLSGPSTLSFTATAATSPASGWSVNVPCATTAPLKQGTYQWAAWASRVNNAVTESYQARAGVFTVLPNIQTAGAQKSHNQRMLEAIYAVLERRVTADVMSYSIEGRSIVKMPPEKLEAWKAIYEYRVAQERNPGRAAVTRKMRFRVTGW